ncbi:MAG TPA: hypothetical protein VF725_07605, partial [Ktedonobacterales bacterium]
MSSPGNGLLCVRCHLMNSADARYCARCGEPVNPQLVADLRRIFETLTELDERIAAGEGAMSVQTLRDTLRERYLAERAGPPGAAAGVAAPPTVPLAQPAPAAQEIAAPPSVPLGQRAIPGTPPAPVAPAALVAPAQPHGPVFSWRAFIAEQAIAVMAYLGGFLLLIATLTFEVGGWQALPDIAKLGGVLGVYLLFGALGIGLRRATSLRTVSRVYLGVFALMTPLAALAVYRFELQARGFPIAGTVCLAAAYAAVVYLALGVRTRFVTYAYLGWAALLVSALAIPTWAQASHYWWIPVANLVALLLLAPRLLRLARPTLDWLDAIEPSATQISASVGSLGALATVLLALATANGQGNGGLIGLQLGPIAAAACALTPLAAGWSRVARTLGRLADNETVMALDWLTALSFAVAASAVATWLGASPAAYTYTMAGTALAEGLAVEALASRLRPALRLATQVLAAALAAYGALLGLSAASASLAQTPGFSAPLDYAPVLVACAVGITLGLLFALRGPLAGVIPWGLVAGAFLLLGVQNLFAAAIPAGQLFGIDDVVPAAFTQTSALNALVALALVALAFGLAAAPVGSRPRLLRAPLEITALGAAIIASVQLTGHSSHYAALILGVFALAALAVARFERSPIAPGIVEGIFGALAAIVYISNNPDALAVFATPIALALATLALRWLLGRAYDIPIYIVTLIATLAAFIQLTVSGETQSYSFLSLGLAAWMTLAVALPLASDALLSARWGWLIAPAAVALLGVLDIHTIWASAALTLALVGVGALLHQFRGRPWEIPWYGAALLASARTVLLPPPAPQHATASGIGIALIFTLAAYAIAWSEGNQWLTAFAIPYALAAFFVAGTLPDQNTQLIVTVVIALAFVGLGMAARLRLGRGWAPAFYAIAILGAAFTSTRVLPYPERAGLLEAILLVFAALAFFAALLEETPWAALAPAGFAAWAALIQPDGHALLPLALGLAATAFAVSRTRGARWSLPLYGAAMIAAMAVVWQGRNTQGGFEVVALVTLALAAWALAALESRPDALLVAYSFAALAVSAATTAYGWETWQATLAFAALAWVIEASGLGWMAIPWLRERDVAWLSGLGQTA